jgi:hypothetical protein
MASLTLISGKRSIGETDVLAPRSVDISLTGRWWSPTAGSLAWKDEGAVVVYDVVYEADQHLPGRGPIDGSRQGGPCAGGVAR